jgi:hypothetical protein
MYILVWKGRHCRDGEPKLILAADFVGFSVADISGVVLHVHVTLRTAKLRSQKFECQSCLGSLHDIKSFQKSADRVLYHPKPRSLSLGEW